MNQSPDDLLHIILIISLLGCLSLYVLLDLQRAYDRHNKWMQQHLDVDQLENNLARQHRMNRFISLAEILIDEEQAHIIRRSNPTTKANHNWKNEGF